MSKHYSNTNRPPLLPQHMTDIYTAVTDLLGKRRLSVQTLLPQTSVNVNALCVSCLFLLALKVNAELSKALEAMQLCLKLLPHGCRDELRRLLTFMSLAADPQEIKVDKEVRAYVSFIVLY